MKPPKDSALFLKKAAEDEALLISIQANAGISDSIFGFHAQQGVEKLFKAVLAAEKVEFPKTHDLRLLLDLLAKKGIAPPCSEDELDWLTPYATTFRYDESSEEPLDRQRATLLVRTIREWVERRLSAAKNLFD